MKKPLLFALFYFNTCVYAISATPDFKYDFLFQPAVGTEFHLGDTIKVVWIDPYPCIEISLWHGAEPNKSYSFWVDNFIHKSHDTITFQYPLNTIAFDIHDIQYTNDAFLIFSHSDAPGCGSVPTVSTGTNHFKIVTTVKIVTNHKINVKNKTDKLGGYYLLNGRKIAEKRHLNVKRIRTIDKR